MKLAFPLVTLLLIAGGQSRTPTNPPTRPVAPKPTRHLDLTLPTQATVAGELVPLTFAKDVLPIFRANCAGCHLGERTEGGLSLDALEPLLRVGAKGPLIVPGQSAQSKLIQRLEGTITPRMPAGDNAKPLAPEVIARLKKWIDEGAKSGEGRTAATVDIAARIGPLPATAALTFSTDGKLLAAGQFGKVVLWELTSGRIARTLTEVSGHLHALAFSPDGTQLAAGGGIPGRAGEVKLFKVADWSVTQTLKEHLDAVFDVSFNADGSRLLTAGLDKTVRVWTVGDGKAVLTLKDHSDAVNACAFAPDGNFYTASSDRTVRFFNGQTGKSIRTFTGHSLPVLAIAVAPDGKSALSAGEEPALRWWNLQAGTTLRNQGGHGVACHEVRFSRDGRFLVSAGGDSTVRIWNGQTGAAIRTLTGATDWVYATAISPDNRLVAGGTADGRVLLWDQASGRLLATMVARPERTSLDWLAATPSGYFDASTELLKLVSFRVAGEAVAPEPFAVLHKPDLVARSLSGQAVEVARVPAPMPPKS